MMVCLSIDKEGCLLLLQCLLVNLSKGSLAKEWYFVELIRTCK